VRKSNWISLAIALTAALAFAWLEKERGFYFLAPRVRAASAAGAADDGDASARYKAGLWMQRAEWSAYDLRFKWRGPRAPNPDILLIAVDEKSLAQLHEWPWPRGIHARLIDALRAAPPKALLFDILFLEPFTADPAGDRALVGSTRSAPWVAHSLFLSVSGRRITGGRIPFPSLAAASQKIGSINAFVDEDGVLRSAPLELPAGAQNVPLLSLVGAGLFLGRPADAVARGTSADSRGEMLVQFAGGDHTFPYVSYADVLSGRVPAERFAGKVVLVGSDATGTYDHYPTPFSAAMPGMEFHANIIDNLISGHALRPAGLKVTYGAIAFFGLLCGLCLARFSAWAGALWVIACAGAYAAGTQWLFSRRFVSIDMAGPLLTLAFGYVATIIYRFFTEEREKRWVKAAFGQYVSPQVLDVLLDDPSKLKLVGERREMTVFFSDVAGFTSISERLNPDELVVLLNRYLSAMTEVVFEHDGYLNKYMGDGIMAFWNAPVRQTDHAERACRCALASMKRLARLNDELEVEGLMPLKARIGINTGIMVVGNMGSVQKSDYTVMGDNVNLGSRLEGAGKAFGVSLLISEFTYEIVQDLFEVRFLDRIRVPGKAKPVKTYELLAPKGELPEAWQKALAPYHEAIQLFADRRYGPARDKFLAVLGILGHDKPCEMYVKRADAFVSAPPAKEWDGVFELNIK